MFIDPTDMNLGRGLDFSINDSVFFDEVIRQIANNDKAPLAIFLLTIRQHGPHSYRDPVADYMARFNDSSEAYRHLIERLAETGKTAGVVAFGDHQPPFMLTLGNYKNSNYITAYDIRCVNFECASTDVMKSSTRKLDITMLLPEALERFGFKLDGFSLFQKKVFSQCREDITQCSDEQRRHFNTLFKRYLND